MVSDMRNLAASAPSGLYLPTNDMHGFPKVCGPVYGSDVSGFPIGGVAGGIYGSPSLGPDPFFDFVTCLLHFDTFNGIPVLNDYSKYKNIPTFTAGQVLTTSQLKYGNASLQGASGNYMELALGLLAYFPGDFTLEFWSRAVTNSVIFYCTNSTAYYDGGSNTFQQYGGAAVAINASSGAWQYQTLCRKGSTLTAYSDGNATGTQTYSGVVDLQTTRWGYYVPNNNTYWTGQWDDIRITNGIGRYTGNFTPPARAHPNT